MNVFKPLEVTKKDFSILMSKSKIHGFGPEESVYDAECSGNGNGQILNVPSDLFLLISGQMTAWCKAQWARKFKKVQAKKLVKMK